MPENETNVEVPVSESQPTKIKIKDQELTVEQISEALDAVKNRSEWQRANTQHAQVLADKEREIQAREWAIQQQAITQQQAQAQQNAVQGEIAALEQAIRTLEEADPVSGKQHAQLLRYQYGQIAALRNQQAQLVERNNKFESYINALAQVQHQALFDQHLAAYKEPYPDLDEDALRLAWKSGYTAEQLEAVAKKSHEKMQQKFKTYVEKKQKQGSRSIAGVTGGSPTMTPPTPIKSISDAAKALKALYKKE